MPWFDYVLRGAILAVSLLVMTRIAGKRFVGEISPVDLVVAISVGTIAGAVTVTKSVPLWVGLVGFATWGAFQWVSVMLSSRNPGVERLLVGRSTILASGGRFVEAGLRSSMLSEDVVRSMLRSHDIDNLSMVAEVRIEPSGKIGLKGKKPATRQARASEQSGATAAGDHEAVHGNAPVLREIGTVD